MSAERVNHVQCCLNWLDYLPDISNVSVNPLKLVTHAFHGISLERPTPSSLAHWIHLLEGPLGGWGLGRSAGVGGLPVEAGLQRPEESVPSVNQLRCGRGREPRARRRTRGNVTGLAHLSAFATLACASKEQGAESVVDSASAQKIKGPVKPAAVFWVSHALC